MHIWSNRRNTLRRKQDSRAGPDSLLASDAGASEQILRLRIVGRLAGVETKIPIVIGAA